MIFGSRPGPRGRGGAFGGGWKIQIVQGVLVGYLLCGSYNWTFEKTWYYWLASGRVSCKANASDPWDAGAKCTCVLQGECEAREWLLGRSTREGGKDAAILFSSDELGAWRGQGGQVGGLEMPSTGQRSSIVVFYFYWMQWNIGASEKYELKWKWGGGKMIKCKRKESRSLSSRSSWGGDPSKVTKCNNCLNYQPPHLLP